MDLTTIRDVVENLHGVPALWCIPEGCDADRILLHSHSGGTVYEMLVGEAIEFAKRAKDAGVDVSLHSLPEGQHNFILGARRVPEVNQAIEEIGGWLRSKLGLAALAAA